MLKWNFCKAIIPPKLLHWGDTHKSLSNQDFPVFASSKCCFTHRLKDKQAPLLTPASKTEYNSWKRGPQSATLKAGLILAFTARINSSLVIKTGETKHRLAVNGGKQPVLPREVYVSSFNTQTVVISCKSVWTTVVIKAEVSKFIGISVCTLQFRLKG